MDTITIAYIVLGVVVVGFIVYQVTTSKSRMRKRFLGQIISAWGNVPNREYDFGEIDHIAKYYEATKGDEFTIDDITWNDLDMDAVYCMVNQCRSSSGDDVLYKLLRTPIRDKKTLDERKSIIDFFIRNEKTRQAYQMELCYVGHSKKFALIDYVKNLGSVVPESNAENYMHLFLYVVGIVMIIAQPATGILISIGILVYNLYTYFKKKAEIEPYYVSIGVIVHLVECGQNLLKLKTPELETIMKDLEGAVNVLLPVKKYAKYLGSTDKYGGNMGTLLTDYINMFLRLDLIHFNKILNKVQKNSAEMLVLMDEIGEIDAIISIASFKEMLPFVTDAELSESEKGFLETKDVYHPLLENPVANSISEHRPVLLTGSNASGKSTFLKTIALNQLLAQTCGFALAKEYRSCFFRIFSSMALKDNLQGNESYFIVEIKSLKRVIDAADEQGNPVMCFVDEVLRGTNTVERIAASSQILKSLAEKEVTCYAATHDIELTTLLEDYYANYHFKEEVKDDDVIFNYRLYEGRATTRNAIRLLGILGFKEEIIDAAEKTAENFMETGEWNLQSGESSAV